MPYFETFRPRGGDSRSINQNELVTIAIPSYANQIILSSALNGGRFIVSNSPTPPAMPDNFAYGWLRQNIPVQLRIMQGSDKYLHLSNTTASANTIDITFGN